MTQHLLIKIRGVTERPSAHLFPVFAAECDRSVKPSVGLLNTVLRPILVILTLPVTLITLGLFLFVINALMFWAAAGILDGFHVTGFGAALLGSLIYSVFGLIIESALERLFAQK